MTPVQVPRTLPDVLALRAAASPDDLAFDDGREPLTFGELATRAEEAARGMAANGVRTGDRVVLILPAGVEFVVLFWATQLLGATACVLNPTLPDAWLRRRVASLAPALVVTPITELPSGGGPFEAPAVSEQDAAILQLTSGTSGESRAAIVTHRNAIGQVRSMEAAGYVRPGDVLVAWVPPWHDMGLHLFVVGAVHFGTPCHIVEPAVRTIPAWLATVERVGATFTAAPDFAYRIAARIVPAGSVDISSLRTAASGGEPIRRTSIEAFEERLGAPGRVVPGYGLAEATLAVTTCVPGEALVVDAHGSVSCGRPFPGVEVRAGSAIDQPGEILVRGETVFPGYLGTDAVPVRDGWLHTGDEGYLDEDGALFVLGRRRAMIKRGGTAIAPRELEDAAYEVVGVRFAAAVGIAPSETEVAEAITVVVELDESIAAAAAQEAVASAVRAAVGFAPHRVVVTERRTIPRTANGKTRYADLRRQLESGALPGLS